ncbi:helix-turn-helix domain-containing protein [Sinomicrobium weinanense]|uniref:Helix-turn-helix transcriptional regulator n=1 Tax=Sinomicrobium weinanense TaxID=2842200 RepID=A0A926JS13_9FLAO|nr:AraC family transcriptional regulator [Sinomicrobium weinanense]MBC9796457.1 helix-turn-helix transcriptional regulator [Sinomicrobium weinanense]MBU3125946.1 AraC family transcriptional regulator [Sinomicrobium weinanense]
MEHIHDDFSIEVLQCKQWKERNRKNNFFELVYVLEGTGFHSVNHIRHPYNRNGIFLLPAARCHSYILEEETTFLFVRFTNHYFTSRIRDSVDYSNWFNKLNFILANHDHHSGELINDPDDRFQLKRLLDVIRYEYEKKEDCSPFIIRNTLASALALISRNIQRKVFDHMDLKDRRFADLVTYINSQIMEPEKLTVSHLSDKFHISEKYFSQYFKRNAGETFQDFVLRSRLRIAASRAKFTDTPFRNIAFDLGFTDSSHLNRMMKKYTGKGMRETRKEIQA